MHIPQHSMAVILITHFNGKTKLDHNIKQIEHKL